MARNHDVQNQVDAVPTPKADQDTRAYLSDLLAPSQVAAWLQVPPSTLYQWRYRAVGPRSVKVGRHLRYRRQDVESWLDQQSSGAGMEW